MEWTHRFCERCWFDGPLTSPDYVGVPGVLDEGEHAGAYRMPSQVRDTEPGPCCGCGGMTITGIFVRADQNTLLCQGRHDEPGGWSRVDLAVE